MPATIYGRLTLPALSTSHGRRQEPRISFENAIFYQGLSELRSIRDALSQ